MGNKKMLSKLIRTGIGLVVVGALAGGVIASAMPISHESSLSFTVNQINKQETSDYQYDGYYAIQASDLFSDTIVSWFQTPSFLLEVYQRAGVDPEIESINAFTSRYKMKKFSSQNLVLAFSTEDKDVAERLSQAIIDHVEERASQLNQTADREALFEVVGSDPVIVKKDLTVVMGMAYGAIAGLVVALFITSVVSAFRKIDDREE